MKEVTLVRAVVAVLLAAMTGATLLFASAAGHPVGESPIQPALPIRLCTVTIESLTAAPPTPVDEGERSVVLTLRNAGAEPINVQGIELAWPAETNGALMEVRLGEVVLWRGWEPASPAVVGALAATSAVAPTLRPGGTATLTLVFAQAPVAQEPYVVVVALDGGCRAAYSTRLPRLTCGQAVEPPRVGGTVVEFIVHNRSDSPTTLRAMQVAWPAETNGALHKLTLDGKVVWAGLERASPATLLLPAVQHIPIEPGASARLGLEFALSAAQKPYTLALFFSVRPTDGGFGCVAGWSSQGEGAVCSMSPEAFSVDGNVLWLDLRNGAELPALLAGLEVFWPQGENRVLREVRLDNASLWRGEATENPALITPAVLATTVSLPLIQPGQVGRLGLVFGQEAAAAPYTVAAALAQGCQVVASTRAVAPSCQVEAGEFVVSGNEARLSLRNPGPNPATVGRLQVYWSVVENQALTEVRLGTTVLWRGRETTSPTTVELTAEVVGLQPGETKPLTLVFEAPTAAPRHYIVLISFAEGCKAFFSTREMEEACQVEVEGLRVEEGVVRVSLHNSGPVAAEPVTLELDWPVDRTGALLNVDLNGRTVWAGVANVSPTLVRLNSDVMASPSLPPDGRAVLSLTFESPHPVPQPYTLSVAFSGGCRAFFTNAVAVTPSRLTRFEGPIRDLPEALLGPWVVDKTTVEVDERTVVTPSNVEPAIGDWAQVTALSRPSGIPLALRVHLTPAIRRGEVEFQGVIQAVVDPSHFVIDSRVVITETNTRVDGQPAVGQVAQVQGILNPDGSVLATSLVVESPVARTERTEFEGRIESFSLDLPAPWIIGGITVTVEAKTVITGIPRVGAIAEVVAHQQKTGGLVADSIEVKELAVAGSRAPLRGIIQALPDSSLLGDWRILGEGGTLLIVRVDASTFVDESKGRAQVGAAVILYVEMVDGGLHALRITVLRPSEASVSPGPPHPKRWPGLQGAYPASVWTTGELVSHPESAEDARAPTLTVSPDGVVHVVWEEGPFLYHRYRDHGVWSQPAFVATGEAPALTIGPDGAVHLVWSNEFGGNYEIYYSVWDEAGWSLPRNVSHTSGVSLAPEVAVGDDGVRHVVWTDNTPGYPVVYHASSSDGLIWSTFPIPSGSGLAPVVALGSQETITRVLHVAWQDADEVTGRYEVFHTQWDGVDWSLPENVSDSPSRDSRLPDLTTGPDGKAHLVWEEVAEAAEVYYSGGRQGAWSLQEDVSESGVDSLLPSLAVDEEGNRHVAWDEVSEVLSRAWRGGSWGDRDMVAANPAGISDPALWVGPGPVLHIAWAEAGESGRWRVYYSFRRLPAAHFLYLPLITRSSP